MANLKNVIYLSNEDYETLVSTGTVTIDGETLTYDENNVYITPDKLASATEDGLMSAVDKNKLNNIESDAQVNVQADWNQTDIGADDYIKNKPAVDTDFSLTSTNALQNKVISEKLEYIDYALTHIKYKLFGVTTLSEIDYKVDYATVYPIPDTLSDDDGTHRAVYSDTQLKEVEGNSVAFNQLLPIATLTTRTVNGITFTNNDNGSITIQGTATAQTDFELFGNLQRSVPFGHKVLLTNFSNPSSSTYFVYDAYESNLASIINTPNGYIKTKEGSATIISPRIRVMNGTVISTPQTLWLKYVDLTKMGLDNITTVEEFNRIFPLTYYPYNTGEIRSTVIKGVKVNGYNLWDYNNVEIGYISNGYNMELKHCIRTPNYISVKGGTSYTLSCNSENFNQPIITEYDENKNFIRQNYNDGSSVSAILTNETKFVRLTFSNMSNQIDYSVIGLPTSSDSGACFHLTGSRTGYAPYKEPRIINIPQTELLSAGSVHDTIKFVEGNIVAGQQRYNMVRVSRINNVDLGTLNWTIYTGLGDTKLYWATISDIKLSSNLLCSSLTQVPAVYNTGDDNSISSHSSQTRVYARTTNAQATASDFKTVMSGVILNYEKAEPTETTLATDLTFEEVSAIIEQGGSIETIFEIVPPNLKTAFVVNKVIVS